jgi:general secretion pathway protein K
VTGDTDSTKSVEAGGDLLTQGFILITVLWLAGLLAVLAIAFTLTTRATLLAGRNILAGERAQYAADGMTLELARRIAQSSDTGSGSPQAGPFQCQWSQGIFISLDTQDQGGLVDINTASPPLLKKLLLGLEADVVRAQLVLDALTDYRDADSLAQSIGSEPETYAARKFGPKNAPLASLDELDQIPELSEDTYWKLRRAARHRLQRSTSQASGNIGHFSSRPEGRQSVCLALAAPHLRNPGRRPDA